MASSEVLRLRAMTMADIDGVVRLEELCFSEDPWTMDDYRQLLTDERDSAYWVLEPVSSHAGSHLPPLLGTAGMQMAYGTAHITTIAVHPDWHRRRIGAWMLLHMLAVACTLGATRAVLEVRADNSPALSLYTKYGFVRVDHLEEYYAPSGAAADVLALFNLQVPTVWMRLRRALDEIVLDLS